MTRIFATIEIKDHKDQANIDKMQQQDKQKYLPEDQQKCKDRARKLVLENDQKYQGARKE